MCKILAYFKLPVSQICIRLKVYEGFESFALFGSDKNLNFNFPLNKNF